MSTNNSTANTALTKAQRIDEIARVASEAFGSADSFEKELAVAQGIRDLRAALTPEVMENVMALMNTSIGFRTDRDPAQIDSKTGKPHVAYPVEVVRDVFIESRLRGFHTVNNEFNIIAGRFYGAVNGFDRLVKTAPIVTDFADTYGVPVMHGDKGAIVKAKATWRQDGVAQVLERDFAIRVNSGMGADAIIGKAKRKLLAAVHSRLTGVVTPEGEAGDVIETTGSAAQEPAKTAAEMFGKGKVAETKAEAPEAKPEPAATAPSDPATPEPKPQDALASALVLGGVDFDRFTTWFALTYLAKGQPLADWQSFEDIPAAVAQALLDDKKLLQACIIKFGRK